MSPPDLSVPDLSIIVTVVDGGAALERCLESLSAQSEAPAMEVIVPYDDTSPEVAELAGRFAEFRFLALGRLVEGPAEDEYRRHVLYDRRRSGGLKAARGRLVAMLEDRGPPRTDWARQMVALHENSAYSAIGGAVENGAEGDLRWAIFFCDFGRYQAPLEVADPEYLTDINICYKREALESVRPLWERRYQEAKVNWALREAGHGLYLSDRPVVVQQRAPISLAAAIEERIHWARTFGEVRCEETPASTCFLWAAATPMLPVLLFFRHFRRQLGKKRNLRAFLEASPATLALLHFWALGECLGYCKAGWAALKGARKTSESLE